MRFAKQQEDQGADLESDIGRVSFTLKIVPDYCVFECTHLSGWLDHTVTLYELTTQILEFITPIVKRLMRLGVKTFRFDERKNINFEVDGKLVEVAFQDKQQALNALRLTAWWIEWKRRHTIAIARSRDSSDPKLTSWLCLDCNAEVPSDQTHCNDPDCPSWDKLHLATGEITLHLVPDQNTASA